LNFILYDLSGPLEWLLDHSSLIHKTLDEDGFGCLHVAARENKIEILDLLLSTKKDNLIDMENAPNGNSPLHLLVRNTPLEGEERAFKSAFFKLVNYMKNQKISDNPIELKNKDGETSLHAACLKANEFCIKLLIDEGAQITTVSINGENPFHYALRFCSLDTFQNIVNYIPIESFKLVLQIKGVEGNLIELAAKYKPVLVPYLSNMCNMKTYKLL